MRAAARWGILGAALLATAVAAWFAPETDPPAKPRRDSAGVPTAGSQRVAAAKSVELREPSSVTEVVFPVRKPIDADEAGVDLFAGRSWYVAPPPPPPPPPVIAAPPPKPVPPALPFAFMGRLAEPSGESVTYLVKDNRSFPVRGGEMLDGGYRVDKVGPTSVEFTYLPLNEKQVLSIEVRR